MITNSAAITSIHPTDIPILQAESSAFLRVVCEGTINSRANTNVAPSILVGQTGSPLTQGTEADIIAYTRTTDNYGSLSNDQKQNYSYGWFQLTDRLLYGNNTTRFVKALQIDGCESLTRSISFSSSVVIS